MVWEIIMSVKNHLDTQLDLGTSTIIFEISFYEQTTRWKVIIIECPLYFLPIDPHIYEFVRYLKDQHEFQHHKSEESQVYVKAEN
jgi:hypothetical protein